MSGSSILWQMIKTVKTGQDVNLLLRCQKKHSGTLQKTYGPSGASSAKRVGLPNLFPLIRTDQKTR